MANPEHLEILKRGVSEWNKWREENPNVRRTSVMLLSKWAHSIRKT